MVEIGTGTYFATAPEYRGDYNNVTFGKYCSIAKGLVVDCGFNHNLHAISTFPFKRIKGWCENDIVTHKGDVRIESDVWIGEDVMIMSGVTIGHGAVIGARSLVIRDVMPYEVHAGQPASFRKYRFNPKYVIKLLEIAWWDWDEEKIKANAEMFGTDKIEEFINKFSTPVI